MIDLYTEDEITELTKHLNELKGKILLDDNSVFFKLDDFFVKSKEVKVWQFMKATVVEPRFYIDKLTLSDASGEYKHSDDRMCSIDGINTLMKYYKNYTRLQTNLIKFAVKNEITLSYGYHKKK